MTRNLFCAETKRLLSKSELIEKLSSKNDFLTICGHSKLKKVRFRLNLFSESIAQLKVGLG